MELLIRIDQNMLRLGLWTLAKLKTVWEFLQFTWELFKTLPQVTRNFHFTVEQMYIIGITSLPLVCLTSVFTGAVAAWQAAYQMSRVAMLH